jgi:hypothetical protein
MLPEFGEVLRRQGLERGELRRDDAHERVDPSHAEQGELRLAPLEHVDQCVELVEDLLEPELTRLMNDDEQQLVGVRWDGAGMLQREQLVEREVRPVRDLRLALARRVAQKVATSSEPTSSTRIISVVKNGSP